MQDIDMKGEHPTMIGKEAMQELLASNGDIIELIKSAIDVHFRKMGGNANIYGVANEKGVILEVAGDSQELTSLGYERGRVHSEARIGSNAIGTCIKTGEATVIRGKEHQRQALWDWAGFGAPIYGSGKVLRGIFFIIAPLKKACQELLILVSIIASSVENQLVLWDDNQNLMGIQRIMEKGRDKVIETTSIVSHEIRNSLANISAYIQMLELDNSIDSFRGNHILREIKRINSLLDDFKLLYGSEENRGDVYPHSMGEIISSVVGTMEPKAGINNVQIVPKGLRQKLMVNINENALYHVFINLIDNAIQVMEDGGKLYIELDIDDDTQDALVTFQDTGPGIPENQVKEIFEIFHTTKRTGSGLGLHITRTLLEIYGGSIEVISSPGEGATFIVRIPTISKPHAGNH